MNALIRKPTIIGVVILLIIVPIIYWYHVTHTQIMLRISTTTSLYATGLLDELADKFMEKHPNVIVQFIAVGSGEALRRASMGDADMVFVHAPSLEKQYIEEGILLDGAIIAYNTFVIVGPVKDPAKIKGLDVINAFKEIFKAGEENRALFVSRGDNSGTHVRELAIWNLAGLDPHGRSWYLESGTGMSKTLLIANEKNAYTLSDIGTYLKLKKEGKLPNLEILVDKGDVLLNIYSVYIVNPEKVKGVKYELAKRFRDFVLSEGQEIIGRYGVEKYGRPLFYPAKGKEEMLKEAWNRLVKLG